MFFARNYRGGPDPHLGIKSIVFVIGAALALGGMVFEVGWLITVAIVLLAVALVGARIARGRPADDHESAATDSADNESAGG